MVVKQVYFIRPHQAAGNFGARAIEGEFAKFREALIHIEVIEKEARIFWLGVDLGVRAGEYQCFLYGDP